MSNIVEEFNTNIKKVFKLFKDLPSETYKSKLHISEMQSRMNLGISAEPFYALNVIGPLIWSAREEISNRDAEFFLRRRYDIDVKKFCDQYNTNYTDAINTVGFMKDAYKAAKQDMKNEIIDTAIILLQLYATHLKNEQLRKENKA